MPTQRQKQVTPPLQDHPAHRNSKRKYRESAPPSSSPYGQSKAPYVVTAQAIPPHVVTAPAIPPSVTEIHAPTPQRQQSERFMQQVPAQYEQHEPNQPTEPAPVQHTPHMTTDGYLARPQAVPAPAPAGTYAFDHAPLLPSNPTTSTAVPTPPPAKKSRFSLQKFKRSPAVAAH